MQPISNAKKDAPDFLARFDLSSDQKDKRSPKDLVRELPKDDQKLLTTKVKIILKKAVNCSNMIQYTINALQDGRFSAKGSGALQLIAFLYGERKDRQILICSKSDELSNQEAG